MKIVSDLEEVAMDVSKVILTTPNKNHNTGFYSVCVRRRGAIQRRILFSSLRLAKNLAKTRKQSVCIYRLCVIEDEDKPKVKEIFFYYKKCANIYEEEIVLNGNSLNSRDISELPITQGEIDPALFMGGEDDADKEDDAEDFRKDIQLKTSSAMQKAVMLLESVRDFFLSEADIPLVQNFLDAKMNIEKDTLAGLLFQLDVAQKAIETLLEKVYNGSATTKQYEALAKFQSLILDINKAQSQIFKSLTEDMGKLKVRTKEIGTEAIEGDTTVSGGIVIQSSTGVADVLSHIRQQSENAMLLGNSLEEEDFEEEDFDAQ